MVSLDMAGPYELKKEVIDLAVAQTSPGNYALGNLRKKKTFIVRYIGRSDTNVHDRLLDHLNEYTHFKFSYAESSEEAFLKECKNFHDFGGCCQLDNKEHPQRPKGENWECPRCDVFDK